MSHQNFVVLKSETPKMLEQQLNELSQKFRLGIINSNISEGTIITTVALYSLKQLSHVQVSKPTT